MAKCLTNKTVAQDEGTEDKAATIRPAPPMRGLVLPDTRNASDYSVFQSTDCSKA